MNEQSNVKLILEMDFKTFIQSKRDEFLIDFANILGCDIDDITDVHFKSGCTIFYGSVPKEFAEIARAFFEWVEKNPETDENREQYREIRAFFEKYNITKFDFNHNKDADIDKNISIRTDKVEKNAIIFVHGWRGDKDSFGILPEAIEKRTGCLPLIYNYPTGVWEKSAAVTFIARNMDAWVSRNIRNQKRKIAIVAHSMGGLVVRKMLVDQMNTDRSIDNNLKHITFVASPYTGAFLSKVAQFIPAIEKSQILDLNPNSSFLFDLNARWRTWVRTHGRHTSSIRSLIGTEDKVVDISSATVDDENPIPLLGKGHVDIIKPSNEDDEIVSLLQDFYVAAGLATST